MTKPRPHAELIKQWADGASIQYRKDAGSKWVDSPDPAWVSDYEYSVKPARVYPASRMTGIELEAVWTANYPNMAESTGRTLTECRRACADAVLRHACDAGQVVTREEFDRAIGDRNKRDIAVAEAVKAEMALRFGPMSLSAIGIACLDVEPILSKVKA